MNRFLAPLCILYVLLILPAELPTVTAMFVDSGIYGYVGQEIDRGQMLYRDVFEIKLPAVYYVYALVLRLFPNGRWTLFFTDIAVFGAMLLLLRRILAKLGLAPWSWLTAMFFTTCYRVFPSFSQGNLNEHFFLLFFLLAWWLLLCDSSRPRDAALGFSAVMLFMFKQSFFPVALVLLACHRRRIPRGPAFLAGFGATLLFFGWVYLRALPYSWDCTVSYPAAWARSAGTSAAAMLGRWRRVESLLYAGPGTSLALLLCFCLFSRGRLRAPAFLLTAACLPVVFASPVYAFHYSLLFLAPLLFAAAAAAEGARKRSAAALLFLLAIAPVAYIVPRTMLSLEGLRTLLAGDTRVIFHPAAALVRKHLRKRDTFITIQDYPQAYYMTAHRSPWRFHAFCAIVPGYYHEELKRLIREKPPDFVYNEEPRERFEQMFGLKPGEYVLRQVEGALYAFSLVRPPG